MPSRTGRIAAFCRAYALLLKAGEKVLIHQEKGKAMTKKILVLMIGLFPWFFSGRDTLRHPQQSPDPFSANQCVRCHSRIATPVALSNSYFEWHSSIHQERGIGCEKCHGGNPASQDKEKAHTGVLPASDRNSRVHWARLPETCTTCHADVVRTFSRSTHYQKLQPSGIGPSCTTCHAHMASKVMIAASETATLCAACHDSINGLLPSQPRIPAGAASVMQSINRAAVTLEWVAGLLRQAEQRRLEIRLERITFNAASASLKQSRINWHTFDLQTTQRQADEAFATGMKLKDTLEKKLGKKE